MAAQRLPEGQIVPQAKPVSAFIEPQQTNIAQPNAPAKLGQALSINTINTGSTPNVSGSYDGLARQLADFNRNLIPALSSMGLAYAKGQIDDGERAAREQVLKGLANNDAAMENAALDRAATNRQLAQRDPQAGGLMAILNPYQQIGYERGMSKAAGQEAAIGLQSYIAKNLTDPGYTDPDQGYSKLVQLQAEYTAQLSEKYGVKLGSPGFQRYTLPEIEKAQDRVLQQHAADRKNYFDTAAVQQAATQVESIYRNAKQLGTVDVNGITYTRSADPLRFEEMVRFKANSAIQNTVLNASLPGEASARSENIYKILAKTANYEVDDQFKSFIDSIESNQYVLDENGKAVVHPGTGQPMRRRWGEVFKGEAIDIEMKYEKAGMERRRETMVESADGFRDNLLAIASSHDPGPDQQKAINDYVMKWWQENGRAAGISLSELQKIRTEVVKLDDDIYQEGQDPNVAGNFFTQLNSTYGADFNAAAQRQQLNDAAAQILDRKEREQFLREGSAQIASREKEMASFAGYNTARNDVIKRAVDSNLGQFYDQSLAGDDPAVKANIDASKTRQMSAFTQRANDLIASEEARLKRRLTDSEVRQLTTAAIYGDPDRKIPAYGAGPGGAKQKEYLFPGSDRTDAPGVANVYDDPALKKTYGLTELQQLQPRKRLQSYRTSPILTKDATLQAWGFVQKGKALPRMLDLAVRDSGAPSAGAFVLAQMDLWKRQLSRTGASKADLQKFDPPKDLRDRVLKNGQRVSAAGNNVSATVAMAPRLPSLSQVGNWAMNALTGSAPAVAAEMPTAMPSSSISARPTGGGAPAPAARSAVVSAPASSGVAPAAPVLPAPVGGGGGGTLVATAPRPAAAALAPAGGGERRPVGQLKPTGVGGWMQDEAGNLFSSSAPLPAWAGTGPRMLATRVPMEFGPGPGGGGGGSFEKPSSVVYERSNGQPGVDLYFESKRFPAVLPGVVKDVSRQGGPGSGYGNYVVVESTDPLTGRKVDVLYAHLADGVAVRPGQRVNAGQILGRQGGTGRVVSQDGTIASIDFLEPAPAGSKSMTPYSGFDRLRRHVVSTLQSGGSAGGGGGAPVAGTPAGYLKRLAYLETRIRNIPNAEGSPGRGYFQAFPAFSSEAIAASGGIDPRDGNYNRSAQATWAWIQKHRPKAAEAIRRGDYDTADRILRPTWPSLPGGSQAQPDQVQREARRYLGRS